MRISIVGNSKSKTGKLIFSVKNDLKNEYAFTLIEVLVICFLISIMLSVGIPTIRDDLLTDQLKTASRKIIDTVRGLREEAVQDGQAFSLFLDLEGKSMWYLRDEQMKQEDQDHPEKDIFKLPNSVRIVDVWTKSGGKMTEGTIHLMISQQGYMDTTVIHLAESKDIKSIFFFPFLGSVKIVDGYADFE